MKCSRVSQTVAAICSCGALAAFAQDGGSAAAAAADSAVTVRVAKLTEIRQQKDKGSAPVSFGPCEPGLSVTLELSGPLVERATHWGMLELSGRDDQGRELQLATQRMFDDPTKEFIQFDRQQMYFGMDEAPKDKVLVELTLTLPARDAKAIALRGTAKLRAAEREQVEIAKLTPSQPISDPTLSAAGLTVGIGSIEDGMLELELEGDIERLLEVKLMARGEDIAEGYMRTGSPGGVSYTVMFSGELPADARLVLEVAKSQTDTNLPIELEKVELP